MGLKEKIRRLIKKEENGRAPFEVVGIGYRDVNITGMPGEGGSLSISGESYREGVGIVYHRVIIDMKNEEQLLSFYREMTKAIEERKKRALQMSEQYSQIAAKHQTYLENKVEEPQERRRRTLPL